MGFDSERVSEGIHHFRRSCYDVWDEGEEPEPEEARRGSPANTVLSCSSESTFNSY